MILKCSDIVKDLLVRYEKVGYGEDRRGGDQAGREKGSKPIH